MAVALRLARRASGTAWPNPAVGCVLVAHRGGMPVVVGRGWTAPGGRPHAETQALGRAGAAARGATAYVTLEPCYHHGQTPPCTEALIDAGVARCVVALGDPDERVSGRGLSALKSAGVDITTDVLAGDAEQLGFGYLRVRRGGLPAVTLKLATTLDGRIATASGESKWITGEEARAFAHALRARHDAVAVGLGTVTADDPRLDCRLPGRPGQPAAYVVFDSRLRMPLDCRLSKAAGQVPVFVVTGPEVATERQKAAADRGLCVLPVDADGAGRPRPAAALAALASEGLTSVMIEGGGQIAAAFLAAGCVDRIAMFTGARAVGGDGTSAIAPFGVEKLGDAPSFTLAETRVLGDDLFAAYRRLR